jgi:hypothetical protein
MEDGDGGQAKSGPEEGREDTGGGSVVGDRETEGKKAGGQEVAEGSVEEGSREVKKVSSGNQSGVGSAATDDDQGMDHCWHRHCDRPQGKIDYQIVH